MRRRLHLNGVSNSQLYSISAFVLPLWLIVLHLIVVALIDLPLILLLLLILTVTLTLISIRVLVIDKRPQRKHIGKRLVVELDLGLHSFGVKHQTVEVLLSLLPNDVELVDHGSVREVVEYQVLLSCHLLEAHLCQEEDAPLIQSQNEG